MATNAATQVQAAEIRVGEGVFWGVQYHPELSLAEIAAALRREEDALVQEGLAQSPEALEQHAGLIHEIHQEPDRRDLVWCLGLDEQVTESLHGQTELLYFMKLSIKPNRSARGQD